jgi:hypothetical protein
VYGYDKKSLPIKICLPKICSTYSYLPDVSADSKATNSLFFYLVNIFIPKTGNLPVHLWKFIIEESYDVV